ncbi:MAG: hypothetical protein DI539_17835 [Flavobacterium psychrophilum]|jgi:ADP-heptose:LPS heptosyltransferase|nr:MAG: hypothetical protein DI539_17835 [Flavobacterium psychrophilum]
MNALDRTKVRRLLLIYELEKNFIGDSCRRFAKLEQFKTFFPNAVMDMNAIGYYAPTAMLLKNNPYIGAITNLPWQRIEFDKYDIIICVTDLEQELKAILEEKGNLNESYLKLPVYSVGIPKRVFPEYDELNSQLVNSDPNNPTRDAVKLYVDEKERRWANEYLGNMGINDEERVIFFLDTSTSSEKVLNEKNQIEILSYFASMSNTKIIVFDEDNKGKKDFYLSRTDEAISEKLLFVNGLNLRQTICLLASNFTKMVFGPSTGLMHCASGVFRNYVNLGMPPEEVPLILVYLSNEPKGFIEWDWWGDSLATCSVLKEHAGVRKLTRLTADNQEGLLSSSEYTQALFIDFLNELNAK